MKTKLTLYTTLIISVLLHASHIWCLRKTAKQILSTSERKEISEEDKTQLNGCRASVDDADSDEGTG
jgi:hypothetical protein